MMNLSELSNPQFSAVTGRRRKKNLSNAILSQLPAHLTMGRHMADEAFDRASLAEDTRQFNENMEMQKDIADIAKNQSMIASGIQGAQVLGQGAYVTNKLGWWGGDKATPVLSSVSQGTPAMAYTPEGLTEGTSLAEITARYPYTGYMASPGEGVSLAGVSGGTAGATEGAAALAYEAAPGVGAKGAAATGAAKTGAASGGAWMGAAKGAGALAIELAKPYAEKWAEEQLGTSFKPVVTIGSRAAQGALMGSMIAPGVGTVVGGIVGGIVGVFESIF